MYRNLDAEQARCKLSNEKMAAFLGISRVSYENKKRSGKFSVPQAQALCDLFKCDFAYLFEPEKEDVTT